MASVEAKKSRTTSKRLFTRASKSLQIAIDAGAVSEDEYDAEIIGKRLSELHQRYQIAQEKHEVYMSEIEEDPDIDKDLEDAWISKVDEEYLQVEKTALKLVNKLKKKNVTQVKMESTSVLPVDVDEVSVKTTIRKLEEANFLQEIKNICSVLLDVKITEDVKLKLAKEGQENLKSQLERCKIAQAELVSKLPVAKVEEEIGWIKTLYEKQSEVSKEVEMLSQKQYKEKEKKQAASLKLERMPLPKFSGEIREYPRFKADFTKQVMPDVTCSQSQAYVLKSCLKGGSLSVVDNVDDDIKEMWKRLDERYGRPSLLIDIVMNDIKCLRPLKERDDKGFLQLIETVERGYRDLLRMKIEREVSNAATVSIIEEKLPRDVKREWAKRVNEVNSKVEDSNKFPFLLEFLLEQRRILEYVTADLRDGTVKVNASVNFVDEKTEENEEVIKRERRGVRCWLHKTNEHSIVECEAFLKKDGNEKFQLVRDFRVCWSCLRPGHRSLQCRYKQLCEEEGCQMYHHKLLHECQKHGLSFHVSTDIDNRQSNTCLLQLMHIDAESHSSKTKLNVLWDGGATLSLITFRKANQLNLVGEEVKLTVVKVGGKVEEMKSYKYELVLIDSYLKKVSFFVYGIEKVSTKLEAVNVDGVIKLFKRVLVDEIRRPTGEIDVLIGFEYAAYHPTKVQSNEHLLLMENRFGRCIGGSHQLIQEKAKKLVKHAYVNHVKCMEIGEFFENESLGVNCKPLCGNCRCGYCPIGGKEFTLKEEREMNLIEQGLTRYENYWVARYPWIRTPSDLPNNKVAAMAMLKSTERRLARDAEHARLYQEQMNDMINRSVARKLTELEMQAYDGPVYYISHHEVIKDGSSSTPCRIVFNSSASFKGHSLNQYWAKGPDLMNNLLGVLLRFREEPVAIMGDISKMYHSVKISPLDQNTHRFLWRDMHCQREPDTYVMNVVSFGDKPAGSIVAIALRNTAKEFQDRYPRATEVILKNTYVDDMIDSFPSIKEATEVTGEIDLILETGGFRIKEWLIADSSRASYIQKDDDEADGILNQRSKVLGVIWNPLMDCFEYRIKLNFSPKHRKVRTGPDMKLEQLLENHNFALTKRAVLSQVNGIYDPLGLATPFTMKAKVLLQRLWIGKSKELSWDDIIEEHERDEWMEFFVKLFQMENIEYPRCIKPTSSVGNPTLIMFSDASERAYGACAYVRWQCLNGQYYCRLFTSKGKVAPLRKITIVRLELSAAVLAKRLANFIEKESRLKFERRYFLVDSEIVRAMIQKETYGFNTFAGTRIGEIQEGTKVDEWFWIEGKQNVADFLTRGKDPDEIGKGTKWQNGPEFLYEEEELWPIKQSCKYTQLPEQSHPILTIKVKAVNALESVFNINRYSSYDMLIKLTAMVLKMFRYQTTPSFKYARLPLTRVEIEEAELCWIQEIQSGFTDNDLKTRFKTLCARRRADGVIIVGTRVEHWMKATYNESNPVLLPYDHRFSRLYALKIHQRGHQGIAATTAKVRVKMWIVNLERMVKSIRHKCVTCKKLNKITAMQIMGALPCDRLKPAPAWTNTMLDFFGPIEVRGEVSKRVRGKAYGVLFTCLYTRATHIELSSDYSTDSFLQTLRRFISIRGCPSVIRSDPGSQLVRASKELRSMVEGLDQNKLREYGHVNRFDWKFATPDAPWKNGCVESLNRSVKKCVTAAIGSQVLRYSELLTVLYEVANLLNERPIGKIPKDVDDGSYLSPNDLLLGRATSRIPSGPFDDNVSLKRRYKFIQSIINAVWVKWNRLYFPTLLIRKKWHTAYRNVQVRDIVLIQDSNSVRGCWKLGRVTKTFKDDHQHVRRAEVMYKNQQDVKVASQYKNKPYVTIERAVQKLVVILPIENDVNDDDVN